MTLPDPPILVITDRKQCPESLESRAAALFRGGCRWLSLREKDLAAEARFTLLQRLIAIASDFGATVGIHDDIEAARASLCPLHLPAGADAASIRRDLGGNALLGQSCHSLREIASATAAAVSYVTMSPVFESAGKPGYGPLLGTSGLSAAIGCVTTPVIALGGIMLSTLPLLRGSGLSGVAVMGEAMTDADPESWFARFFAEWRNVPQAGF